MQLWHRDVPPDFQLVVDTEGRKQANEQEVLRAVAEHERDLAHRLLKQAVEWLPRSRAEDLRRQWRDGTMDR